MKRNSKEEKKKKENPQSQRRKRDERARKTKRREEEETAVALGDDDLDGIIKVMDGWNEEFGWSRAAPSGEPGTSPFSVSPALAHSSSLRPPPITSVYSSLSLFREPLKESSPFRIPSYHSFLFILWDHPLTPNTT
jgi:hypothetical protein